MRESTAAIVCRGRQRCSSARREDRGTDVRVIRGLETFDERLLGSQQRWVSAWDLIPHDARMENIMGFPPAKGLSGKYRGAASPAVRAGWKRSGLLPSRAGAAYGF